MPTGTEWNPAGMVIAPRPVGKPDMNVMKARHDRIDDVLDSLHRTMRDQALGSQDPSAFNATRVASFGPAGSHLSGGRAARVSRRPYSKPVKVTKAILAKRKQEQALAKSMSRAEGLVLSARALGIDVSKAENALGLARHSLKMGRLGEAKSRMPEAESEIKKAISFKLPELLSQTRQSLSTVNRVKGNTRNSAKLLEQAWRDFKKERHGQALRALEEARAIIKDAEREVMLRVLLRSKRKLAQARQAGLDIEPALELIRKSREEFRIGNLESAMELGRQAGKQADSIVHGKDRAARQLAEGLKSVRIAEVLGVGTEEMSKLISDARRLFKINLLDKSAERSVKAHELSRKASFDKAIETFDLAERAVASAKSCGIESEESELDLRKARDLLEKDSLVKSVAVSTTIVFECSQALMRSVGERIKSVDQFAKGIEGEVESLGEVLEAIETSRERSLQSVRKHSQMSEDIVKQAFESAAAYTRVSQDVVKQSYESAMSSRPEKGVVELREALPGAPSGSPAMPEDRKLRLVNLYLAGKITEDQLDRLVALMDSSLQKENMV